MSLEPENDAVYMLINIRTVICDVPNRWILSLVVSLFTFAAPQPFAKPCFNQLSAVPQYNVAGL